MGHLFKKIIMGKDNIVFRTRKFQDNRLLNRKQCILDVFHAGEAAAKKDAIAEQVAGKFRSDPENVVLFGFKTRFGGGRSSGFCLIYDNKDSKKKFEPTYRLRRSKDAPEKDTTMTRKIKKELKIKRKKVRGVAKTKISAGKKK